MKNIITCFVMTMFLGMNSEGNIGSLPDELKVQVFRYLPLEDLLAVNETSKGLRRVSTDSCLWRDLEVTINSQRFLKYERLPSFLRSIYLNIKEIGVVNTLAITLLTSKTLTGLNLCLGKNIWEEGAQKVGLFLSLNKGLRSLHLTFSNSRFSKKEFPENEVLEKRLKALADGLFQNTTLTELSLSGIIISSEGSIELPRLLSQNSVLRSLDLSVSSKNAQGALALAQGLSNNETLTNLDLEFSDKENPYASRNPPIGIEALVPWLSRTTVLRVLSLEGHFDDQVAEALAPALSHNVSLRSLSLYSEEINSKVIKVLGASLLKNPALSLMKLNLGKEHNLDIEATGVLGSLWARNTNLTELDLFNFWRYSDSVARLAAPALSEMIIQSRTLKVLNLSRNVLSNEGIMGLEKALSVNNTITELNLRDNNIYLEGAKSIASILEKNTTLKSVSLDSNMINLTNWDDRNKELGIQALMKALVYNTTLTDLNLDITYISDTSIMSMMLTQNTTLRRLSLRQNNINDEGAQFLIQGLSQNTTLTELDLSSNRDISQELIIKLENMVLQDPLLRKKKIEKESGIYTEYEERTDQQEETLVFTQENQSFFRRVANWFKWK